MRLGTLNRLSTYTYEDKVILQQFPVPLACTMIVGGILVNVFYFNSNLLTKHTSVSNNMALQVMLKMKLS